MKKWRRISVRNDNGNNWIAQDSQQVTLAYYAKWNNLSQEEKKEYEEMSKKYATSKEGTIINNANIDGQSFFSLIHLRYIWLENPGRFTWSEWMNDRMVNRWMYKECDSTMESSSSKWTQTLWRLFTTRSRSIWSFKSTVRNGLKSNE